MSRYAQQLLSLNPLLSCLERVWLTYLLSPLKIENDRNKLHVVT
jgi:hypothetical protein